MIKCFCSEEFLNLPVPHSLQRETGAGSSDRTEISIFNSCQEENKQKAALGILPSSALKPGQ